MIVRDVTHVQAALRATSCRCVRHKGGSVLSQVLSVENVLQSAQHCCSGLSIDQHMHSSTAVHYPGYWSTYSSPGK